MPTLSKRTQEFRKKTLECRQAKSAALKAAEPKLLPVIVSFDTNELYMKKDRFQMPCDFSARQVQFVIRKRLKHDANGKSIVTPEQALFFFIEATDGSAEIFSGEELMGTLAKTYTQEDGFIYMTVSKEATFG